MNITKIILSACFLISTLNLLAQRYAYEEIPVDLIKGAKEIIRNNETKIVVKDITGYKYSKVVAHTILNENSRRNTEVLAYDSNSKILSFKAMVYDKNGELVSKSKKKDIKDYSNYDGFSVFSDNRVKVLTMAHSSYPYTIEFRYEIAYEETFSYPNWYIMPGFNTSVQSSSYEIILKEGTDIHFQNQNTEVKPEAINISSGKSYKWAVDNIPAIKHEPLAPMHILPAVRISPQSFEMDKLKGSMESWETFGNFMYRLNEGRSELSPEMKAKVQELTANLPDTSAKIDRLYRYIQENMRYVSVQLGIGGFQTFEASYVEKNKYGDCKALTYFMRALLKEAGIEAHPALIYAGDSPPRINDSFTESAFNHVILNIPSQACWLECTSSNSPTGYFGSNTSNRKALVIKENGSKLVDMPTIENNLKKNHVLIELSPDGKAVISNSIKAEGMAHETYRASVAYRSEEEIKESIQKNLSIATFSFKSFSILVEENKPEAAIAYTLDVPKYASKGGKRLFVPLNPINKFSYRPKAVRNRKLPVYGDEFYNLESTIELMVPEGYKVESIPSDPIVMNSPFGKYKMDVKQDGPKIVVTRSFNEKPFEEPAEKYKDYRTFYNKIAKSDKVKAVFIKAD